MIIRKGTLKLLIALLITIPSFVVISASNTDVLIEIQPSRVANLYYEILENGQSLKEDISFELIDSKGNRILHSTTQKGILLIENVPFDTYKIVFNNTKQFDILLDSNYLKTQHILKILDIGTISKKTSDETPFVLYSSLFCISSLLLLMRKRGEM